jgi:hypothetical protein
VLILHGKQFCLTVKLYSVDGKLWLAKPVKLTEFKPRRGTT